jgi:hypothetical protein
MPQVLPGNNVNRWYRLPLARNAQLADWFAERYFDSHSEALAHWQQRCDELGFNRVHRPVPSHENRAVWAVCILPE